MQNTQRKILNHLPLVFSPSSKMPEILICGENQNRIILFLETFLLFELSQRLSTGE